MHLKDKRLHFEFISTCSFPEEAIEEVIEDKKIDLVVMGNRGDSALEKLLGSTTTHLIHRTDCPVLAVPEEAIFANIDSVLFATDYQQVDHANKFQGLISLARAFSARIDILHITPNEEKLSPEKLIVGESLDRVFRQVSHTYHHQQGEDVLDGLQRYLERHEEAGILAMMPRDHSLWERLTKGSITNQVVFEADRPVLVFRS
jgi:nucleotide-binding universal stress UspA family protein